MTTESLPTLEATTLPAEESTGVPNSPESSEQAPAEAESLETQIAALKSTNEKLEGQRRSQDQRLSKVQSEAASLQQIRERVDDLALEVQGIPDILVKGFETAASGKTEDMAGVLSATQGRIRAEKEGRLRQSEYGGMLRRMQGFGPNAEAVTAWSAEVRRQNETEGAQSLDKFREILDTAREAQYTANLAAKDVQIAEGETKLKGIRAEVMKEYEIEDVNTGPASGGAGGETATVDNIDALYMENPEKHADTYRRFLRTGQLSS